jgi:1-acyl-sn-glycerol-3-phosphate acyltransferase
LSAGVPIIPVAHNAGECCPRRSYMKHSGTVTVSIGKPISTEGKTSRELTAEVKDWIENEIANMPRGRKAD